MLFAIRAGVTLIRGSPLLRGVKLLILRKVIDDATLPLMERNDDINNSLDAREVSWNYRYILDPTERYPFSNGAFLKMARQKRSFVVEYRMTSK